MLRRPVAVQVTSDPFVPHADGLEEVDDRWAAFVAAHPGAFDGRLLHVLGVHRNGAGGATLHAAETSYRYYAVQSDDFDLGVRPLGAKGLTWRGDRVLLGRRAAWVKGYPGCWEFAPGGTVEPGESPGETVVRELAEETGWLAAGPARPVALLEDVELRCWELVHRLEAGEQAGAGSNEYVEVAWCRPEALPDGLSSIARTMAAVCLGADRAGEPGDGGDGVG